MVAVAEKRKTNEERLAERQAKRDLLTTPEDGDFVVFVGGEQRLRISYVWHDGVQVSDGGSWHVFENGKASFSGALYPLIPMDALKDTGTKDWGSFWFFDEDLPGAGRGVDVKMRVRVWLATCPSTKWRENNKK